MNFKTVPNERLDLWFSRIKFKMAPRRHQLISVAFALKNELKRVAFYHDIGTGKTGAALMLLQCWVRKTGPKRTLVVAPSNVILNTWKDEIPKFTNFTFCTLMGTKEHRLSLLKKKFDIYLINYEGLKVIGGKKRGSKYVKDTETILGYGFDVLIADESHAFKNPFSLQTRICATFSAGVNFVLLLSGTPFEESTLDLFGARLVQDTGRLFGLDFMMFRMQYFWQPRMWAKWQPKHLCHICGKLYGHKHRHLGQHRVTLNEYRARYPQTELTSDDLLLDRISGSSIRYTLEECADLPPATSEVREVLPTPAQSAAMEDIYSRLAREDINEENAEAHAIQALEVTGGFIMEKGKVTEEFDQNPKVIELLRILREMSGKAIIYHYFVNEGCIIGKALKKAGFSFAEIRSEVKDKNKELERFRDDPACRFLISQPRSGGVGLNLQFCHWSVFYSTGYIGTILHRQACGRIRRVGQLMKQVYIYIVMKGTPDEVIYDSLTHRQNHVRGLMEFLRKHAGRSQKKK